MNHLQVAGILTPFVDSNPIPARILAHLRCTLPARVAEIIGLMRLVSSETLITQGLRDLFRQEFAKHETKKVFRRARPRPRLTARFRADGCPIACIKKGSDSAFSLA